MKDADTSVTLLVPALSNWHICLLLFSSNNSEWILIPFSFHMKCESHSNLWVDVPSWGTRRSLTKRKWQIFTDLNSLRQSNERMKVTFFWRKRQNCGKVGGRRKIFTQVSLISWVWFRNVDISAQHESEDARRYISCHLWPRCWEEWTIKGNPVHPSRSVLSGRGQAGLIEPHLSCRQGQGDGIINQPCLVCTLLRSHYPSPPPSVCESLPPLR